MSKRQRKPKNPNPYKRGNYVALFAYVKQHQIVTRKQLLDHAINELSMSEQAAAASVTVVLSPRAKGASRGDCRGNASAQGHIYFMEKLNRKKGEDQKLRLRFRKTPLEPLKRATKEVKQTKTKKTQTQTVTA